MSGWLRSVNNLLNNLDDNVVVDVAAVTQRVTTRFRPAAERDNNDDDDDDDDDYDDDEEEDDGNSYDEEEVDAGGEADDENENAEEGGVETATEDEYNTGDEDPQEQFADDERTDGDGGGGGEEEMVVFSQDESISSRVTNSDLETDEFAKQGGGGGDKAADRILQVDMVPPASGISTQSAASREKSVEPSPVSQEQTIPLSEDHQGGDEVAVVKPAAVATKALPRPPPPRPPNSNNQQHQPPPPKAKMTTTSKQESIDSKQSFNNNNNPNKGSKKKEFQQLLQTNAALQKELNEVRAELQAQQDELILVAKRMEKERQQLKEEREDLLEEQDEELQQCKDQYEQAMKEQKSHYEQEIQNLRDQLLAEEQKRLQEGGNWTTELEDALQRERHILKELDTCKSDKANLEAQVTSLQTRQQNLDHKVITLTAAVKAANERERVSEEKLDTALSQHKRQLQQRQERETELEQTILELGTALTRARDVSSSVPSRDGTAAADDNNYKAQYEAAVEELESMKTQNSFVQQQCTALQKELQDIARERAAEAALAQERQREHDLQMNELQNQVRWLETSSKVSPNSLEQHPAESVEEMSNESAAVRLQKLTRELDQTKRQLATMSEQLMRQKTISDMTRTEMVTMQGRLEAAILRADSAESALASRNDSLYEVGTGRRRRFRSGVGGGGRYRQLPSRSLLSLLGMHITPGSVAEQVAVTIDALDSWMMETGHIMRHEPFARLGFAVYLLLIHCWCLGLVFFHGIESEHGDLGSFTVRHGTAKK